MKVIGMLVVVAVLAACGSTTVVPGETLTSSTPTPTAACPTVDGQPLPERCAGYDSDAAMRANDAYRQRGELSPNLHAAALVHRDRIGDALRDAVTGGAVTPQRATAALAPLGYDAVQSYGSSDVGGGLALGVSTDSGCVYGGVRGAEITLEVGGAIADGGCLPAQGH